MLKVHHSFSFIMVFVLFITTLKGNCPSLTNCQTCTGSTCTACLTGFDFANSCNTCLNGYYLSPVTGTCLLCAIKMPNCQRCSDDTTCTLCINGYDSVNDCNTCIQGYYSSSGACLACSDAKPHCALCSNSATCDGCVDGYALTGGNCNTCAQFYYMDGSSNCKSCFQSIPHCLECSNAATCTVCLDGFQINTGCTTCLTKYWLSGSLCVLCSTSLNNCVECSLDGTTCTKCLAGYKLETGSCDNCQTGFYNTGSYCKECSTSITNCLQCTGPSVCTRCSGKFDGADCLSCLSGYAGVDCSNCLVGFFSASGVCSSCSVVSIYCNACASPTVCDTCSTNYIGATCNNCAAGYFKTVSQACDLCSNLSPNCATCNGTAIRTCTTCNTGYSGLECQNCVNGYFGTGAGVTLVCTPCPSSCSACNSASDCTACNGNFNGPTCSGCIATYYLSAPSTCTLCSSTISHCQNCNDVSTCTLCDAGYINALCDQCDSPNYYSSGASPIICSLCSNAFAHCLTCPSDGSVCLTCEIGYNQAQNCGICSSNYYASVATPLTCTICPVIAHCLQCSGPSTCETCDAGYAVPSCSSCLSRYYDSDSDPAVLACTACSANCNSCDNTGCLVCDTGFDLGAFVPCSSCMNGFYSTGPTCTQCPTHCTACTSASSCSSCAPGYTSTLCDQCDSPSYYQTAAGPICTPCSNAFAHCLTCPSDGSVCLTCEIGYNQAQNCGICSSNYYASVATPLTCTICPVIAHCLQCSGPSTCATCDAGYAVPSCSSCLSRYYDSDSDPAVLACTACSANCNSCDNTGCLTCDSGYNLPSCSGCSTGYYNNLGTCTLCTLGINSNCLQCTDSLHCTLCSPGYTGALCNVCALGYYDSDLSPMVVCSTCSVIPNCQQCTSASSCVSCSLGLSGALCGGCLVGYFNSGSGCTLCSSAIPNCNQCSSALTCSLCASGFTGSTCLNCASGFYSNSGSCLSCTANVNINCKTCTSTTSCSLCTTGYSGATCTSCALGYYSSSGCQSCTVISSQCKVCSNGVTCSACATGYLTPYCSSCSTGYYATGSGPTFLCTACSTIGANCVTCSDVNTCLICGIGFTGVKCTQCALGYSGLNCATCAAGYYLNNGLCTSCSTISSLCISCAVGGICTACSTGFTGNTCASCANGYYPNSGTCRTCQTLSPQCTACDSLGAACTSCTTGYTGTLCSTCSSGYYLSSNSPITCTICTTPNANCVTCDSASVCTSCLAHHTGTLCNTCQTGYTGAGCGACAKGYLLSAGTCVPCIANCNACPDQSTCTTCVLGYATPTCSTCATGYTGVNCASCDVGYYRPVGLLTCVICTSINSQCLQCSSATSCSRCATNYQGTTCTLCVAGYINPSCAACDTAYFQSGSICSPCTNVHAQCQTCTSISVCTLCTLGYQVPTCNLCSTGYYNSGGGTIQCTQCTTAMPHCLQCTASSTCTLCSPGWTEVSQCSACATGHIGSSCENCDVGYYMNALHCATCRSSITHCRQCDASASSCTLCDHGFATPGCNSCVLGYTAPNCDSCITGYYLNGIDCLSCTVIPQCITCSDSTHCTSCSIGYTDASCGTCTPGYYASSAPSPLVCTLCTVGVNSHCLECSDSTHCTVCSTGWKIPLCDSCDTGYTGVNCDACIPGYILDGGICKLCSSLISQCQQCSSTTVCTLCNIQYQGSSCSTCSSGYSSTVASPPVCLACTDINPNCITCDSARVCLTCRIGYTGPSCSVCAVGYQNPNCAVCSIGYYVSGLYCDSCAIAIPHCLACTISTSCSTCEAGYVTTNCNTCDVGYYSSSPSPFTCSLCTGININCLRCTNSNTCSLCTLGFAGNTCAVCAPGYTTATCDTCSTGYYSSGGGVCSSCNAAIPQCNQCSSNTLCTVCAAGYQGNLCEICSPTYYQSSNTPFTCATCVSAFPHCHLCSNNVACSQCMVGFVGSTCATCDIGYASPNCNTCIVGFYQTSVNSTNICLSCLSISSLCQQCSNGVNCSRCAIGFTGSSCLSCDIGYVNPNCSVCSNGYFRNSLICSSCTLISPHCLSCSNGTICSQCAPGYKGLMCQECILNYGYRISDSTCNPCLLGTSSNGGTTPCFNNNISQTVNSTTNQSQLLNSSGIKISPNLTLAPPPSINQTVVSNLPTNANAFISSTKLEAFKIVQSAGTSTFQYNSFNRSFTDNTNIVTLSESGTWSYSQSSTDTLSCITLKSATSIIAINYDSVKNTLTKVFSSALTSLPTNSSNSTIVIGQGCKLASIGAKIYTISLSNLTQLKSFSSVIQASSADLTYIISGGVLYRLQSGAYTQIQTLSTFIQYKIKSLQDQLIIYGWNSTSTAGKFNILMRLYIATFQTNFNLINNFNITSSGSLTNQIPVMISPSLTKIHYIYYSNSTAVHVFKQIDFAGSAVTDIQQKSKSHFLETTANMNSFSLSNYFLGDGHLVIRNDSNASASNYFEEGYEFVGSTLVFLRGRTLGSAEALNCFRMSIDYSVASSGLTILDLYPDNTGSDLSYDIYSFSYGSLASLIKVIPQAEPTYLTFTPPVSSTAFTNNLEFTWIYLTSGANSSTIKIYRHNDSLSTHYAAGTITISAVGQVYIRAYSSKCLLVEEPSNIFKIYQLSQSSTISSVSYDSSFYISSMVGKTKWGVSTDCSKFRVNQIIFTSSSNFSEPTNDASNSNWLASDQTLTYQLFAGSIKKYSLSINGYKDYLINLANITNVNVTYDANTIMRSSSNGLVLYRISGGITDFVAFVDTGSTLIKVLELRVTGFTAPNQQVIISPDLSKLIIYGSKGSSLISSLYHIDFANKTWVSIGFPTQNILDRNNVFIALEESWLYIRQLESALQTGTNQQYSYSILNNAALSLTKIRAIPATSSVGWAQTVISLTSSKDLQVYTQINQAGGAVYVQKYEVKRAQQLGRSSLNNCNLGGVVVSGGGVQLCTAGCSDCSTGDCIACYAGYILDLNTATCLQCGTNCLTCSTTNTKNCFTCAVGSYLSSSTCQPCSKNCVSCSGTASSCIDCPPGKYYNSGSCDSCPRNCLACSSATICTSCRIGFSLSNNACQSCIMSCASCDSSDINVCTSCFKGLELINGVCVACPDRCLTCFNGLCAKCVDGYYPNTAGKCINQCNLPCKTCSETNPSLCMSCFSGSKLSSNTCVQEISCNNDSSCRNCGQGNNYVLVGGTCVKCPAIANCSQCRPTNTQACSLCTSGYYVNDAGTCSPCDKSCSACISGSVCSLCSEGYTFSSGFAQGQCLTCTSPCLTCSGSQTDCTSCVSGFTKKGWKCESNMNTAFTIKLNANNVAEVMLQLNTIVVALLRLMGLNSTYVDAITFSSIKKGSVDLSGSATPISISSSSVSSSTSSLSSGLTTGSSLGNFSVTSVSVVSNGIQTTESSNLGLIIGLAVALPLLTVGIIIAVYCYNKRNSINTDSSIQQGQHQAILGDSFHQQANNPVPYDKESPEKDEPIYELGIDANSDIGSHEENARTNTVWNQKQLNIFSPEFKSKQGRQAPLAVLDFEQSQASPPSMAHTNVIKIQPMRMDKPVGTLKSKSDKRIMGVENYSVVKEEQISDKSDNISMKTGKSGFIIENELVSQNSESSDNPGSSDFDQKTEKLQVMGQKKFGSFSKGRPSGQSGHLGSRAELFQPHEPKQDENSSQFSAF